MKKVGPKKHFFDVIGKIGQNQGFWTYNAYNV